MRMPGWFRALFVAVMLACCAESAWFASAQYGLAQQKAELEAKLETSRLREKKQRLEYEQVSAALPQTLSQLEVALPKADEAKAEEKALREKRKRLREEVAALREQLASLGDSYAAQTP